MSEDRIPVHLWTNGGERVFALRYVSSEHKSYGGYQWPDKVGSTVTEEKWNPAAVCWGGFHCWPWGIGIGGGKEPVFVDVVWQVISYLPNDSVWVDNEKAKCREVRIEYLGSWWGAYAAIEAGKVAWIQHGASGSSSATGERGSSSATGERGSSSATGERGSSSATGWSGSSSATGASGSSSATGASGIAVTTGEYSQVECGPTGIAASTADIVTWIVTPGAVFVQRWSGNGGGVRYFKAKSSATPGERITFNCGKITCRVKPKVAS